MASSTNYRAEKAGFAKEIQDKLSEKFDGAEAAKTLRWIKALPVPDSLPECIMDAANKIDKDVETIGMNDYHGLMKNGLVLGYLIACCDKSDKFKIRNGKTWQVSDKAIFETSRQRERIGLFLTFCQESGVSNAYLFQTDQLYEQTNLVQVVTCISQLGVEMQSKDGYEGPAGYWLQKHQTNKRQFTEEQLKSGSNVIGLQMGSNQGANASGVSFGARRHVMDIH